MKVDFIILEAHKSGTTILFDMLNRHPSIVGSNNKEAHFFSTTPDWKKDLRTYERLFTEQADTLFMETSTSYTFYPLRNLNIWNDLYEYNSKQNLFI
ncbi:hypothetical protein PZB74_09100 [Porifericola rhodea]|uniref:hypothetical protein n=1 Tax=Porifericola rhodea TaxID=930972 RepID=UPI0026663FDB|nr:hypothetical protein [Porifericola rhodea]WKN33487.1 hypothetical protein PZB74_09100 [Porifericola rhodea]